MIEVHNPASRVASHLLILMCNRAYPLDRNKISIAAVEWRVATSDQLDCTHVVFRMHPPLNFNSEKFIVHIQQWKAIWNYLATAYRD